MDGDFSHESEVSVHELMSRNQFCKSDVHLSDRLNDFDIVR